MGVQVAQYVRSSEPSPFQRPRLDLVPPRTDLGRAGAAQRAVPRQPADRAKPDPGERPARVRLLRADEHAPILHSHGVLVLTIEGARISAITRFVDSGLLPHFGLPRTLPRPPGSRAPDPAG